MDAWQELWKGLTPDERKLAAAAFWQGEEPQEVLDGAIHYVAEQLRFRPHMFARLPLDKRTNYLARARRLPPEIIGAALRQLHLRDRRPMLARFLDELKIPHDDGLIDRAADDPPPPAAADLGRAAHALLREFPQRDVDLYLRVLRLQDPDLWTGLKDVELAEPSPAPPPPPEPPMIEDEGEDLPEVTRARTFRHLDKVVIRTIIDSVADVEGSLTPDQVRDLVEEIVHLNQERQQSYFHLGLLDVLQDRPVATDWPESNESRRLWYLAGALSGLTRRNDLERSRALIRERPAEFRKLGRGEHEAAGIAVPLLWDALGGAGALSIVTAGGLARAGETMLVRALSDATELLREMRSEEARPILDAVDAASRGLDVPPEFLQDVRRRQAHTRRLAGDFDGAATLLQELLGGAPGAYEGMVHADLGLVACRVRSLAEVRAPESAADWRAESERLAPGLEHFRLALGGRGGHGEYCLGVYHLLRQEFGEALPFLDRAHGQMQASPEVYDALGVLARVRLYLARCLAEQGSALYLRRVRELLGQALPRLRKEALCFLEPILMALGVTDEETASAVAVDVFSVFGPDAIDALASAEMLRKLPEARAALLARAATAGRPRKDRFADFERALQACLRAQDREGAEAALDGLEDIANDERFREPFLELLDDRDRHGDVWSDDEIDEARFRLCDRAGQFDEAVAALERLAHRMLSRGEDEEARDIVERIRAYKREPDRQLVARLEGVRPAPAGAVAEGPAAAAAARGRVFVIGGNEVQAAYDGKLREWAAARWPKVELDLEHPGWSSNWGRQVDGWDDRLAKADTVVLMRFVRTQLGRTIRARCSEQRTPWVACTGHGRASLERAIERAVQLLPRG